jgi:ATP-dependent RNA helicase DHX36
VCYHLYLEREKLLPASLPEVHRSPLEALCLRLKSLGLGGIRQALASLPSPPSSKSVDRVLQVLAGLQLIEPSSDESALSCWDWTSEALTPLGNILAVLPIAPTLGKMLVLGLIYGCIEPILIVAATLESRSIFHAPMHAREAVHAAKQRLDPMSDHIASLKAVKGWQKSREEGWEHDYIADNSLSWPALNAVTQSIQHLRAALGSAGLVRAHGAHADNMALVKAVIAASLYDPLLSSHSIHQHERTSLSLGTRTWPLLPWPRGRRMASRGSTIRPSRCHSGLQQCGARKRLER